VPGRGGNGGVLAASERTVGCAHPAGAGALCVAGPVAHGHGRAGTDANDVRIIDKEDRRRAAVRRAGGCVRRDGQSVDGRRTLRESVD